MRVTVNGVRYAISFHHDREVRKERLRGKTFCMVRRREPDGTWVHLCGAVARCHIRDSYNKQTGRDVSFQRALNTMAKLHIVSRDTRRALWMAYRMRAAIKGWPTYEELVAHAAERVFGEVLARAPELAGEGTGQATAAERAVHLGGDAMNGGGPGRVRGC